MRILLLFAYDFGDPTFAIMAAGLADSYRKLGHEAVIAFPGNPGPAIPGLDLGPGENIHFLGKGRINAFIRLLRLLRGKNLVHLHTSEPGTLFLVLIWLACLLKGVPIGASIQDYNGTARHKPAWWEAPLLEAFASRCIWVTSPSSFVVKELARNLPILAGRARVVPHGLEHPPRRLPTKATGKNPFILCVGRLMPYKGIDLLLMAFRDICQKSRSVDLVICGHDFGDTRYRQLAESLDIQSRVRFIGPQARGAIWALMRSCLFFVLPSRQEAFGIAALEAMAAGKAVLATRSGGPEDFLKDGQNALLVASRNIEALRDGMLRLLDDPALRRRLGQAGAVRAQDYHWNKVAQAYLAAAA